MSTPPRLHVTAPLQAGSVLTLGATATRHAQVLRLQPGDVVTLFNGLGGEWRAEIAAMGKREVMARALEHQAIERELPLAVTLALVMPAGERMDVVVEKATELGATAIQPLLSERSVLRLSGERADKRRAHWQAIAVAACEQCGRNRVPEVQPVLALDEWLHSLPLPSAVQARWLLGWHDARPWPGADTQQAVLSLSGPEGGLTPEEQARARAHGFITIGLGARTLRADTAPLAVMAALSLPIALQKGTT